MCPLDQLIKAVPRANGLIGLKLTNTSGHPFKPVLNPSAHYVTLLHGNTVTDKFQTVVDSILEHNTTLPIILLAAIELQYLNGLRISEILSIKGTDIRPSGHVRVKLSKSSGYRLAISAKYRQFWLSQLGKQTYIYQDFSRFYFYRLYKKLGLSISFANSPYNAVTHSFRHSLIQNSVVGASDVECMKSFIHHNSINSTNHYATKQRKPKK